MTTVSYKFLLKIFFKAIQKTLITISIETKVTTKTKENFV